MNAEEFFALPKVRGTDHRLIRGQLVERPYPLRSPAHASVLANLYGVLHGWKQQGWGIYGYGCSYRLTREPDTVISFDASVVPDSVLHTIPNNAMFLDGRPDLAIEVVDMADSSDAVIEQVEWSLRSGVGAFWQVDPYRETVTVYRRNRTAILYGKGDILDLTDILPGFICHVATVFE